MKFGQFTDSNRFSGGLHPRMGNVTSAAMRCLFLLLAFVFGIFYIGGGVVQQARIIKAFNASHVSFFLLYNGVGYLGAFNVVGSDFLDRLNATLNGPGSSAPFTILVRPYVERMSLDIIRDWM